MYLPSNLIWILATVITVFFLFPTLFSAPKYRHRINRLNQELEERDRQIRDLQRDVHLDNTQRQMLLSALRQLEGSLNQVQSTSFGIGRLRLDQQGHLIEEPV